ncbi:peptidylprolyl isomerase [Paenibacillus sp. VCA1]|uniref:peptidylprolyl isomerase n=1 Tax=Paenibacillus sp. VCA1 TaxID=3039148 RepID=UPI002871D9AD|nr:peptidylprolyl isomerase [Paenibacillus sp. VCA1]MDR9857628.1 peptidylprolyl isomerase [Paenibacillus sp. VCA1]
MSFNNRKAWKAILFTVISAMILSVLTACEKSDSASPKDKAENNDTSKVVATYKGGKITAKQLETQKKIISFTSPENAQLVNLGYFQDFLVKQMIAFDYLSGKAADSSKKEGEKQADQLIEQNKKNMGDEQFKKELAAQNLKEEDLRNYLVKTMTAMEDMNSKVTEDEIKNKFEANKQDYTVATLHHVLIGLQYGDKKERTKEEALRIAKDVKSQLDKGADFAEIAKTYSDDSATKENGGLYENFTVGQYNINGFKEQVLTLPLNKISDPFETTLGYHIVKVDSRKETTFDQLTKEQKEIIKYNLGAAKIDNFIQNQLKDIIQKIDLPKTDAKQPEDSAKKEKTGSEAKDGKSPQPYTEKVEKAEGTSGK